MRTRAATSVFPEGGQGNSGNLSGPDMQTCPTNALQLSHLANEQRPTSIYEQLQSYLHVHENHPQDPDFIFVTDINNTEILREIFISEQTGLSTFNPNGDTSGLNFYRSPNIHYSILSTSKIPPPEMS